jgi:hypothetical protein
MMIFLAESKSIEDYAKEAFYPAKLIMETWIMNLYNLGYVYNPEWVHVGYVKMAAVCRKCSMKKLIYSLLVPRPS